MGAAEAAIRTVAETVSEKEGLSHTVGAAKMLSILRLQVGSASLRGKVELLRQILEKHEKREMHVAEPTWPHTCIWRDELDVRECQLEKITAELDRSNNALHAAQAALTQQRERHEEMKNKHR